MAETTSTLRDGTKIFHDKEGNPSLLPTPEIVLRGLQLMAQELPPDSRNFTPRQFYYSFPSIFADERNEVGEEEPEGNRQAPARKATPADINGPIEARKQVNQRKVTGIYYES